MELIKDPLLVFCLVGEVVAIVAPSRRRQSVVGVLQAAGPQLMFLLPLDARMPPRCAVSAAPQHAVPDGLLLEALQGAKPRSLVVGSILDWPAASPMPIVHVRGRPRHGATCH